MGTALTATVNGDGEYSSPPVVPAIPGSYRWVASYSGDTDNAPVAPTPCGEPAEATVIGQVMPVLSTTVSANVTLGGAVRDTANLSGGSNPTGTITFKLYGPNDSSCKTQVGAALIVTVNGNGEYASPPITPSTPGTYNWVASYSGDTDNAPVAPTPCGEPAEATVVSRVQLVIGTTAGGSVTLGEGLHDTANLSGGSNPTGTITFKLYGQDDTDCTAQVGEAVSVTVSANGSYTSPAITPTTTGTYHWVASYSGDGDNAPAGPTPCNDPNESASVQPKPAPGMTIVKTQRLAGSEDGYQRTPLGVTIGQEIAYQMLVENTGNMPLALSLSDAVCDGGTLSGPTGEMEAGQMLTPGGQAIYSCTHVALSGDGSTITNTATVTGTPPKGHPVGPLSSSVLADVASQGVLPAKSCVSGTVTLNGAAGCTRRPFKAKLSAAGVVKVTFYLDGRKLRTMTSKEARSGQLLIGIDPLKLAYGVHRLTAKIELTCGHKQIMRTLIFIHCRPPVVKPTFTG